MTRKSLPQPRLQQKVFLNELLNQRRSIRLYEAKSLTLEEISELLWAADGQTTSWGGRTAPSAGATYPLDLYLVSGQVELLEPGIYAYQVQSHSVILLQPGDIRNKLAEAAYGQKMVKEAPATIVIAATPERTTARYGERGWRYIFMEAGHCGQNIHLQAANLGLGTVMIGAFEDSRVQSCLGIIPVVLYLCPVGRRQDE
ncbi:MAG: SagB/ThcOx family dehydrogenase [Candidatus Omnitrophica bacterium]|nr:SagB/ThcOx family dehydrogenase [Candidatus Omnitrophota bacterium]